MMNTQTNTAQDYLTDTKLCNCDAPWLRKKVETITAGAHTPKEKALQISTFYRLNLRNTEKIRQLAL